MSVRRAQAEIDAHEFAEWMAYMTLEPFGPNRDDLRAGTVAAMIANVNRDSRKRSEPFVPGDFFPEIAEKVTEAEAPAPATLESKLTAWARSMAGNR